MAVNHLVVGSSPTRSELAFYEVIRRRMAERFKAEIC